MTSLWNKPFASEQHELVTHLRPAECEQRLLAQLTTSIGRPDLMLRVKGFDPKADRQPESTPTKASVWGIVNDGTFTLHRDLHQLDAFKTIATGTLEPGPGGTRLCVTLQPSPAGVILLAAVPLFLLFWSTLSLVLFLSPSMQQLLGAGGGLAMAVFSIFVLLGWFALVYLVWRWLSIGQDHFFLEFLCATLDAQERLTPEPEMV
jgi:hypothetical protein